MFTYLHDSITHSDYSVEYMNTLGLSDEIQESVLSQLTQYNLKIAEHEQDWVIYEMKDINKQIEKIADSDDRAIATDQEWRDYRKALRNYVKGGKVVGVRPIAPT